MTNISVDQDIRICILLSAVGGVLEVIATAALAYPDAQAKAGRATWSTNTLRLCLLVNVILQISASIVGNLFAPWYGPVSIVGPTFLSAQLLANMVIYGSLLGIESFTKDMRIGTCVIVSAAVLLPVVGPGIQEGQDVGDLLDQWYSVLWNIILLLGMIISGLILLAWRVFGSIKGLKEKSFWVCCILLVARSTSFAVNLSYSKVFALDPPLPSLAISILLKIVSGAIMTGAIVIQSTAVKQNMFVPLNASSIILVNAMTGIIVWEDWKVVESWLGYVTVFCQLILGNYLLLGEIDLFGPANKRYGRTLVLRRFLGKKDLHVSFESEKSKSATEGELGELMIGEEEGEEEEGKEDEETGASSGDTTASLAESWRPTADEKQMEEGRVADAWIAAAAAAAKEGVEEKIEDEQEWMKLKEDKEKEMDLETLGLAEKQRLEQIVADAQQQQQQGEDAVSDAWIATTTTQASSISRMEEGLPHTVRPPRLGLGRRQVSVERKRKEEPLVDAKKAIPRPSLLGLGGALHHHGRGGGEGGGVGRERPTSVAAAAAAAAGDARLAPRLPRPLRKHKLQRASTTGTAACLAQTPAAASLLANAEGPPTTILSRPASMAMASRSQSVGGLGGRSVVAHNRRASIHIPTSRQQAWGSIFGVDPVWLERRSSARKMERIREVHRDSFHYQGEEE